MFVCCECCVLSSRGLRGAYHSSIGVLPTVVRRCVWSRNLVNEEALTHWGLLRHKHKNSIYCRYQWPRGLRRGSVVARLLGLRVRIPSGAWMSVCCVWCVLSGTGLCIGLITGPKGSYRVWCVWVWSWSLDNEAYNWPTMTAAPL